MTSRPHSHRVYHRVLPSLFVLAAMGVASPAIAEDSFLTESARPTVNYPPRLYLTLASGVAPDIGLAGMAGLTVGGEHLQVTGRIGMAGGISIMGPPATSVGELGLMVGYGQTLGLAHFYAAGGMGVISVDRRGREIPYDPYDGHWHTVEYERIKETTFNIPIQVGVDLGRRVASGGLALVASLNSSASYVGFLVTVNLGKLR
jgi:hypothetical protein